MRANSLKARFQAMRLPNGENALVDKAKLVEYCLNLDHPRGRHKARVFSSVLGITRENSEVLYDALIVAAREDSAVEGTNDEYGWRFTLRFELATNAGRGIVVSAWIMRKGEEFPRLVSCYLE